MLLKSTIKVSNKGQLQTSEGDGGDERCGEGLREEQKDEYIMP